MKREAFIILGLITITLVAFAGAGHCDFVNFDDFGYVKENPHVMTGISPANFRWAWASFEQGNYLPLTWLSFMLDATIFGRSAAVFHWVNVALHAANVLLLYALLRQATGSIWRSALLAATWAIHPLRVESVVWIVERKDVLTGFFGLLTMLAYLDYARRPQWSGYVLTCLLFAATLLAKQVLATLPFVMLLLDYWPLGRWCHGTPAEAGFRLPRRTAAQLVIEKLPLLLMAVMILLVTVKAQAASGAIAELTTLPLSERLANVPVAYARYLGKMFWFGNLSVFYPLHHWSEIQICGSCLLLASITAVCLWTARSRPWLVIGWLWFLGVLVPMIGIVQFGHVSASMADRFTYFSGIGLLVMAIWSIPEFVGQWKIGIAGSVAMILAVLIFSTRLQTQYWQNSVTLFARAASVDDSSTAELNLGAGLIEGHNVKAAIKHFKIAITLDPNRAAPYGDLARALFFNHQYSDAIAACRQAINREPKNMKWRNLLTLIIRQSTNQQRLIPNHPNTGAT